MSFDRRYKWYVSTHDDVDCISELNLDYAHILFEIDTRNESIEVNVPMRASDAFQTFEIWFCTFADEKCFITAKNMYAVLYNNNRQEVARCAYNSETDEYAVKWKKFQYQFSKCTDIL